MAASRLLASYLADQSWADRLTGPVREHDNPATVGSTRQISNRMAGAGRRPSIRTEPCGFARPTTGAASPDHACGRSRD
jgi:hypothetical protein